MSEPRTKWRVWYGPNFIDCDDEEVAREIFDQLQGDTIEPPGDTND